MLGFIFLLLRNYKCAKYIYTSNLIRYKILEYGNIYTKGARVAEIQSNMAWCFNEKSKDYIQLYEITAPDYAEALLFLESVEYVYITKDRKIWGLTDKGKAAFNNGSFRNEYITAFYSLMNINTSCWSMTLALVAIIIAIIGICLK